MNERLEKIFSALPLKITVVVIFLALVLFFIDAPFLRFMELKGCEELKKNPPEGPWDRVFTMTIK